MPEEVLTVPQAAERLHVTPETIRRMLRRGDLAGWLIGGSAGYRIFASEIERILNERRRPAARLGEAGDRE